MWTISDQAVASLTTLVVVVVFAQRLPIAQFGAISIVLSLYALALGASRAVGTDSLLVRHSASDVESWAPAARSATLTSSAVATGVAAVLALAALSVVGPDLKWPMLVLALVLPALCLQDGWRFVFFSAARPGMALANDLVWLVGFGILVALPATRTLEGATASTAVWSAGGVVACGVGLFQVRRLTRDSKLGRPAHRSIVSWVRDNRDLVGRFLLEFALVTGTTQIVLLAVGGWQGLEGAGQMRTAALIVGPAGVLANGLLVAAVPEAVRKASSGQRIDALVLRLAAIAAAVLVTWSLLAHLVPDSVGEKLLGEQWALAVPLVTPLGISHAGIYAVVIMGAGLRAIQAVTASLRAVAFLSVLVVISGIVGASVSALAACTAMAVTAWIGAIGCLLIFRVATGSRAADTVSG